MNNNEPQGRQVFCLSPIFFTIKISAMMQNEAVIKARQNAKQNAINTLIGRKIIEVGNNSIMLDNYMHIFLSDEQMKGIIATSHAIYEYMNTHYNCSEGECYICNNKVKNITSKF